MMEVSLEWADDKTVQHFIQNSYLVSTVNNKFILYRNNVNDSENDQN